MKLVQTDTPNFTDELMIDLYNHHGISVETLLGSMFLKEFQCVEIIEGRIDGFIKIINSVTSNNC